MRLGILLIITCSFISALAGENLVIAISSAPNNLNPLFSTDANSQNINRLLYKSLIDFDRQMRPQCEACQSFTEEVLPGGKHQVTFKLKEGLSFHDGSPIDASAIKQVLSIYQNKEYASVFLHAFSKIIDFKIRGPFDFSIIFDSFDYDNLPNLTLLKFFKLKGQFRQDFSPDRFIGSGDYWFQLYTGTVVEIKPMSEKANLGAVSFKVVKDETTAALKIINNEIDISIVNMNPRKFSWLQHNTGKEVQIVSSQGSNYVYLNLNHENKFLKQKKIRKAIAHLIPKDKIIKHRFKGFAKQANSIFSPSFKEYFFQGTQMDFNPAKAERLLLELGAEKKEGFYYLNGEPLQLELIISSNKNVFEIAKIIEYELAQVGVKIDVKSMEWGTFMRRYKAGQFDLVLAQWVGFTGPGILNYIFHSKSIPPNGGNRGRYRNSRFESLYAQSLEAKNQSQRSDLVKKAVQEVFEDVAYVSLWHPEVTWVAKSCIENLKPYSNGSFRALSEVSIKCQK